MAMDAILDNDSHQYHVDMREYDCVKLITPCPAVCWFNGLFKPYTVIRVVDISNGGMMFFSLGKLSKKGCTIRISQMLSVHGEIVWKQDLMSGGAMYGFKADKKIKDEIIESVNDVEKYMVKLKDFKR